jgi:chorismate mutase
VNELEQLRAQVKQIDTKIIESLAKRQELVKKIGEIKVAHGIEIVDLEREEKLYTFYEKLSEQYQLPKTFVKRLFKLIINYSRMVQKS